MRTSFVLTDCYHEEVTTEPQGEGAKLKALLEKYGKKQADLSRVCNVATSRVSFIANLDRFPPGTWDTVRTGLELLGIPPTELRPEQPVLGGGRIEDLRPLLARFDYGQLDAILKILSANDQSRYLLRIAIEERQAALKDMGEDAGLRVAAKRLGGHVTNAELETQAARLDPEKAHAVHEAKQRRKKNGRGPHEK